MRQSRIAFALLVLLAFRAAPLVGQPTVSEKKEVAIFSLGYYGWDIPLETLATVDIEIQKVFLELGRFTISGMTQRFSSSSVDEFIAALRKAKEVDFVMPEKYIFGEAFLTEAEFNRLLGAFIVAIPVITSFDSQWVDSKKEWQTELKTTVTFIDVSTGSTLGIADVESSGSSKETQFKAIQGAIDGIPMSLQYEIRLIPAFQLSTRVLAASGSELKLQMGADMGIKKGYEFAIVSGGMVGGFRDEREVGLVVVKDVGPEVSTAQILYSSIKPDLDTQLREIPRLGADLAVFLHPMSELLSGTTGLTLGLRVPVTLGFYGTKPWVSAQIYFLDMGGLNAPISAMAGIEWTKYLGRLQLDTRVGAGAGSNVLTKLLEEAFSTTDDDWLTHYGVTAGVTANWLVTRDLKVFAEAQFDFMLGIFDALGGGFASYGGPSVGVGVTFKP